MDEYIIILLFVLWYGLSLYISEHYGKNNKPGTEWLFFISIILSPLAGWLIAILSQKH